MTDEDHAALAELMRSPFWGRIEAEVLGQAAFNPIVSGKGAAEAGMCLSYIEGFRAFAATLHRMAKPVPPKPKPREGMIYYRKSSTPAPTT